MWRKTPDRGRWLFRDGAIAYCIACEALVFGLGKLFRDLAEFSE